VGSSTVAESVSGLGRRSGHREPGILREDRALQLAQALSRLDPELLDELAPGVLVGLERVGLAVASVQREHQLRAQALPVGVLGDQRLELPHDLGVTAERELRLDQLFHRRHAQILETRDLRLRERLIREIGEHRASPQAERPVERFERLRGASGCKLGATLVEHALEAVRIHLLGADFEAVAVGTRDHDVVATVARPARESLAQARDVDLKRLCGGGGRLLAPQFVDQAVAAEGLAPVEEQQREHRA
jgi:hypothetical protein